MKSIHTRAKKLFLNSEVFRTVCNRCSPNPHKCKIARILSDAKCIDKHCMQIKYLCYFSTLIYLRYTRMNMPTYQILLICKNRSIFNIFLSVLNKIDSSYNGTNFTFNKIDIRQHSCSSQSKNVPSF